MSNLAIDGELTLAKELRMVAQWCAVRGLRGSIGDPLPELISTRAVARISADLGGFQEMIRRAMRPPKFITIYTEDLQ